MYILEAILGRRQDGKRTEKEKWHRDEDGYDVDMVYFMIEWTKK